MRSIRMLAAVIGTLALVSACGDGGGTPPPENEAPVANFTPPTCTINVACTFTDGSTDDVAVTIWDWNFGDNTPHANTATAAHTYTVAGTYVVELRVTDAEGLFSTKSAAIVIAPLPPPPPPENVAPTAAFTFTCDAARACVFNSSTSTDTDGTIAAYSWNFGDGSAVVTEANPTHTYAPVTARRDFTVILTVTDDDGAQDTETKVVTIEPPPSLVCSATSPSPTDGRPRVLCILDVTQRSTLTITMTSHDCQLGGNKFEVVQPVVRTIFFNGCSEALEPAGKQYQVTDAAGAPRVFDGGTQVHTRFTQGTAGAGSPPPGTPTIRLDGSWPTWTLNIDDGGNPGPGEPDYNDIVLTVNATRVQ